MNMKLATYAVFFTCLISGGTTALQADTSVSSPAEQVNGFLGVIPLWAEIGLLLSAVAIVVMIAQHRVPEGSMFSAKKWKSGSLSKNDATAESDDAMAHTIAGSGRIRIHYKDF